MAFEDKESLASELVTFVDNDGDLYRGQTTSILKNLVTNMARGQYDRDKAVKLFMYLAESGAKKYAKVFGGSESGWHEMFPTDIRKLAATHWRDDFETEAKEGNYDDLLPKKYQPKPVAPRGQKVLKMRSSPAYEAGKTACRAWCQSADPSRATLKAILREESGILKPHEELIRETENELNQVDSRLVPRTIAKTLGITAKDVGSRTRPEKFQTACRQYDIGYYDACQNLLDAMEGN